MTKSFFSTANVTGFSVRFLIKKFLMQLSISFIENVLLFNISFKWNTSEWYIEKSERNKNVQKIKVKLKPFLCSSEMKLLKFKYTPLNVGLWNTDVLEPLAGSGN